MPPCTLTELRPLALSGNWGPHMGMLKEAKASLDLPFNVMPCEAFPASPTRVLALEVMPAFLCDYAIVKDPANQEAMRAALSWVLNEDESDPRAVLLLDQLKLLMGNGVREVFDEYAGVEADDGWG
jgi:hypothetical protein